MNKIPYIKPQCTRERVIIEHHLLANSWGTDGDHKPIIEGDPGDKPLDAKQGGLWDGNDDMWNTWGE